MNVETELLQLTERLLAAIAAADWDAYQRLCDPMLTAFEPEAAGCLIEGLEFHRFYFDLGGVKGRFNTTISAPKVKVMGDVGVVAYVRLTQRLASDQTPYTTAFEETRIWRREAGVWKHVHFHRSTSPANR